jgi:choline dehydrogenase
LAEQSGDSFDYIVVGAGSSGCVVAARLSEDPAASVLLLEAGGSDDHPLIRMPLGFLRAMTRPEFNWTYMTEPEPNLGGRRLPLPRGRVMGGSGSINGMFAMRGHPGDYDQWAQMGARGWSFAEVLPYFRRLEDSWRGESEFHGEGGPVRIKPIDLPVLHHERMMETGRRMGFPVSEDLGGEVPEGFARGEMTADRRGRRVSAASAYIKPALGRRNLDVRQRALVRRVVFEGKRCVGVEVDTHDGPRVVRARREVILSGGTYNSPHLLMLSGIGPAAHLKDHGIDVLHDSPGVGRNLQEHATASLEWNATEPVTFLSELRWDKLALSAVRWAAFGTGTATYQVNSCNVVIKTRPELERPDMQIMVNPIRFDAQTWFPGIRKRQQDVWWAGIVQLHPESRGWVELKSADPREVAAVTLNILDTENDRRQLRDSIRLARKIYRTEPMGELVGEEKTPGEQVQSDDELDAYLKDWCYVGQHPTSTCAMGMGDRSVVDSELRVLGVEGLRVADASVMPTVPGGNTMIPAIMVGEKAADLIRGRSLPAAELAA